MTQTNQADDKKEIAKLRKALEKARSDLIEKDIQLQRANQQIEHLQQDAKHLKESSLVMAITQQCLSVLTAISLGLGINFVTSSLTGNAGLVLIFVGVGMESVSFYLTYAKVRKIH